MEKEMRKLSRLFIIIIMLIRQCDQGNFRGVVDVSLTWQPPIVFQGGSVLLECGFNSTSAFKFNHLEWYHNGVKIAKYDENFELYDREQLHVENNYMYKFPIINETHAILEVHVVNSSASGNYTCSLQFNDQSSKKFTHKNATALLTIQVLPTNLSLYLSDENGPLADGGTAKIPAQRGKLYTFFFEVNGTRPKASIKCYLDEERLETYELTGGENETRSVFTIKTTESDNKQLKCTANTSYSKDPPPSIQVTVHVDASTAMGCRCSICWVLIMASFSAGLTVMFFVLHIAKIEYLKRLLEG